MPAKEKEKDKEKDREKVKEKEKKKKTSPAPAPVSVPSDSVYINRELSWLAFNQRVLLERNFSGCASAS